MSRRTGIVLKDTGVRDEHGLEPIEGIFSSPQKPLLKQNGATQYSTITEDDSMDTGDSSEKATNRLNEFGTWNSAKVYRYYARTCRHTTRKS